MDDSGLDFQNKSNESFSDINSIEKNDQGICSKKKSIKNWTKEEDSILLETAKLLEFKNWKKISDKLEGRSAIQCSARYKRIRPGIVKGAWSIEEDEKLKNYIKRFGRNWSLISKYMPSRSGKQIRDRYLNTLDPTLLKDKFSSEEDKKIIDFYCKYGSSWSLIAKKFNGRTGDMIKNRFYSSLKKLVPTENNNQNEDEKKSNEESVFENDAEINKDDNIKDESVKNKKMELNKKRIVTHPPKSAHPQSPLNI